MVLIGIAKELFTATGGKHYLPAYSLTYRMSHEKLDIDCPSLRMHQLTVVFGKR